jgi:hypothetical protein
MGSEGITERSEQGIHRSRSRSTEEPSATGASNIEAAEYGVVKLGAIILLLLLLQNRVDWLVTQLCFSSILMAKAKSDLLGLAWIFRLALLK